VQQEAGAVVTSFNQRDTLGDAVRSALRQTRPFSKIVVVDDGSTQVGALDDVEGDERVMVLRQANRGVSAARNAGIAALDTELVAVLDGDDAWEEEWAELVAARFEDQRVIGASSHVQTFGVADLLVTPAGGDAVAFLAQNNCPSSLMFRRSCWERAGGYDEEVRDGFEDWDFALRLLSSNGRIDIVPRPLIRYRTAPASPNLTTAERRLELYARLIDRHSALFQQNFRDTLLRLESISSSRLAALRGMLVRHPEEQIEPFATFGDGGVAAAVRVASMRTDFVAQASTSGHQR